MYLRDTLSKELKPFNKDKVVKIYSCGPTVYDYPHLGNWYAFLRWDLLVRILKSLEFETLWVMNITDVGHLVSDADEGEDKLVQKAKSERKTAIDIADFYTAYFLKTLEKLNFLTPDHLPKASEHIDQQISLIEELEKRGFTYIIDDGVYYDTSKLADYGKLAQTDRQGLQPGIRVAFNPQKRNSTDFALWKLSPVEAKRDMEWDSPWGKGFPGWHLECSAMSWHYLNSPIDIHTGGIDHIPTHHTNELAQSEPVYGRPLANIWLHSNFITVNGEKMSKSLNNFFTFEDVENRGYDFQAFRLAVFAGRYFNQADFNWDLIENAKKRLQRLRGLAARLYQLQDSNQDLSDKRNELSNALRGIKRDLADDLNSPKALEKLETICQKLSGSDLAWELEVDLRKFLQNIDDLFGLKLSLTLIYH